MTKYVIFSILAMGPREALKGYKTLLGSTKKTTYLPTFIPAIDDFDKAFTDRLRTMSNATLPANHDFTAANRKFYDENVANFETYPRVKERAAR